MRSEYIKFQALFWVRLVVINQTLMYEIWKTATVVKTYAVADGRNAHMVYEKNPCSFKSRSGSAELKHSALNFLSSSPSKNFLRSNAPN